MRPELVVTRATTGEPETLDPQRVLSISGVPWSTRGRPGVPPAAEAYVTLRDGRGGLYILEGVDEACDRLRRALDARAPEAVLCGGCLEWDDRCMCKEAA